MSKAFFTDDGPASLAPFFSARMGAMILVGLLVVCGALLLAWPRQAPHAFLSAFRTPQAFFLVCAAVLVVYGYVNLCSGRGEIIENTRLAIRLHEHVVTWEERCGYVSYTLPVALAQAGAFLVILAPPMAVSATLTHMPAAIVWPAFLMIWVTGFFCRMVGFFCFLLWGRWHLLGYAVTRFFFLGFVFGTALFAPQASALRILYDPMGAAAARDAGFSGHVGYLTLVMTAMILLILVNGLLWRRNRNRRAARESDRDGTGREVLP